jgi:hypothetical protein
MQPRPWVLIARFVDRLCEIEAAKKALPRSAVFGIPSTFSSRVRGVSCDLAIEALGFNLVSEARAKPLSTNDPNRHEMRS